MMAKRRKKDKSSYIILLLVVLVFVLTILATAIMDRITTRESDTNTIQKNEISVSNPEFSSENLYSKYAVLFDLETWDMIFAKEYNVRMCPASLTKIMTAVILLEYSNDLETAVTLEPGIFEALYEEGASMAGFLPGETVKEKDLLYGILLPSGAECCIGVADYIAGSESNFVDLMNSKAQELGMKNTHFENSTGLDADNHYSSVEDIAILLRYALQYDAFREAFTTHSYYVQPTNMHSEGIMLYSRLFNDLPDPTVKNGEIEGGKTGYTEAAGLCLASVADINGKEYIFVSAGAEGNHDTQPFHILDAQYIYNSLSK